MVFLGLVAAGLAAIDWFSVWRALPRVEQVAKPAVMVAFILLALGIDADPSAARWLVVVGLAFGLAGDIFLLPQVDRFLAGLGAFLLGHGFYVAGFATMDLAFIGIVGGCAAAAVLLLYLGWPIMQRVRGGPFAAPVSAYLAMTVTVVIFATATHRWPIACRRGVICDVGWAAWTGSFCPAGPRPTSRSARAVSPGSGRVRRRSGLGLADGIRLKLSACFAYGPQILTLSVMGLGAPAASA